MISEFNTLISNGVGFSIRGQTIHPDQFLKSTKQQLFVEFVSGNQDFAITIQEPVREIRKKPKLENTVTEESKEEILIEEKPVVAMLQPTKSKKARRKVKSRPPPPELAPISSSDQTTTTAETTVVEPSPNQASPSNGTEEFETVCSKGDKRRFKQQAPAKPVTTGPVMSQLPFPHIGLQNLGNTCYMNSCLQVLMHMKPLVRYITKEFREAQINHKNALGHHGQMILALQQTLNECLSSKSLVYTPQGFKDVLGLLDERFRGFEQQDAMICLSSILNLIHESVNRVSVKPYVAFMPTIKEWGTIEAVVTETVKIQKSRDRSVISAFQWGLLQASRKCHACQHTHYKFDQFGFLPVSIERAPNSTATGKVFDLLECLEADRQEHVIDEMFCSNCENFNPADTIQQLYSVPDIFIVQLKRFSVNQWGGIEKKKTPVSYPLDLDLTDYCCGPKTGSQLMYRLFGVIVHEGGLQFGHYWSYAVNGEGKWAEYNDSLIMQIPEERVVNPQAYILLYERVNA